MKFASLVVRTAKGALQAIPGDSLVGLVDAAQKARQSGVLKIGGVEVQVKEGVVLASWRPFPAYTFQYRPPTPPVMADTPPPVMEDKPPAEVKARAKK